jgi:chromate transporter
LKDLVWYFSNSDRSFRRPGGACRLHRRDLVEDRRLIDESTYNLSIAFAQIMPGPLAVQTAMAIGYFQSGGAGATLVGPAFILPSSLMVLGLSVLDVVFGGMPWM